MGSLRTRIVAAILVVFTTYAQYVAAQTTEPDSRPAFLPPVVIRSFMPTVDPAPFRPYRGMWTAGAELEGFSTFSGHRDTVLLPALTVGVFVTKSVSLNLDAGISHVDLQLRGSDDDDEFEGCRMRVRQAGGLMTLRKIIWRERDLMLSADIGAGAIHADGGFPLFSSEDQIVRTAGLTADIRLNANWYLTMSARYARFSNDFFDRVPSRGFNGMNYSVGLRIEF